ncbi:phosphomannomutase [Octadecabacter sp. G9-8]|uniref:Phosphomannomutase n=1 Tax=Octadecabacter dasysiphoniae TaxID=2909341 RepID=A0ABS9CY48_9RHOB|nr:phosphomannomutase [Octadecabacter dasysiphoniae]MCF2872195.1 phosphomannomutase [Octadecabacter dasysiphoniae]
MKINCFKSYDVRGKLGEDLNEEVCERIGRAFARVMKPEIVVTGRDIRASSEGLQAALHRGLIAEGITVYDIGLCGTEEVYFATDHLGAGGGLMVTASHNPIDYNGIKMVRSGARPIAAETGLADIQDMAEAGAFGDPRGGGSVERRDPRGDYVKHLCDYVARDGLKPLKIVVNAGNGAAGPTFDALAARLDVPWTFARVNHEPDSTFPNGIPNPLLPENRSATGDAVIAHGADLGVAWDGDFDRCFFFDETGAFLDGEYVVALLGRAFCAKELGARIVYDARVIWSTMHEVEQAGGQAVASRVGHSHIKKIMRDMDAAYGGEMSAHHYFRNFMYCDSGMIPWLLVAELVSRSGAPLSEMVAQMRRDFPSSGEINFTVSDRAVAIAAFETTYAPLARATDRLDGISFDMGDWRVNVRASNTEPVVRLNVETRGDCALLDVKVTEISALLARI